MSPFFPHMSERDCGSVFGARISSAGQYTGLRIAIDTHRRANSAGFTYFVALLLVQLQRIRGKTIGFDPGGVWQPLVMNSRCIDRSCDVHVMVYDIQNRLQAGIDDRASTG